MDLPGIGRSAQVAGPTPMRGAISRAAALCRERRCLCDGRAASECGSRDLRPRFGAALSLLPRKIRLAVFQDQGTQLPMRPPAMPGFAALGA